MTNSDSNSFLTIANSRTYSNRHSVKTKIQVQDKPSATALTPDQVHYTSTLDAISKIYADEGLDGLYSGINGALIGVASTNFSYFYWYSIVRTLYASTQTVPTPPGTAVELSLGAVAGAIAQMFTIPVSVVTTRQQTQTKAERKGLFATGREIVNSEDGVTGLWRGLKASLILVVNPAITYGAYQRLRVVLFKGKTNLRPWEAFGMYLSFSLVASHDTSIKEIQRLTTDKHSARRNVKSARHAGDTAAHRRQGRPSIPTTTRSQRQALQVIRGSHEVHHRQRGPDGAVQGHWPAVDQGIVGAGFPDDDEGEVCTQYVFFSVRTGLICCHRVEFLFVLFFAYLRRLRSGKLKQAAELAAAKAKATVPLTSS